VTINDATALVDPHRHQIEHWTELWGLPGLLDRTRIEISTRLRTSLGLCYLQCKLIRLHPVMHELSEQLQQEILCHELAHVAVYELHGDRCRPHGREWASLMKACGFEARARLPSGSVFRTAAQKAHRREFRYHHRCPVCNAARTAGRPVYSWRCVTCVRHGRDGRLKVTRELTAG
jgi:predicted SprT family Zn-dependent metalloprotease